MIKPDPDNPLSQLTYRELLSNKSKAERAAKRGRNKQAVLELVSRIDEELSRRRILKLDRLYETLPASLKLLDD